jgi:hypothetical protein
MVSLIFMGAMPWVTSGLCCTKNCAASSQTAGGPFGRSSPVTGEFSLDFHWHKTELLIVLNIDEALDLTVSEWVCFGGEGGGTCSDSKELSFCDKNGSHSPQLPSFSCLL